MNESALNHINMFLDAYSDVIKGIFAVKGMTQKSSSVVSKMNIGMKPGEYADRLRLLFTNLSASIKKIGQENLDEIVFELDDYYLILRRKYRTKGSAPLFFSILTTKKNEGLETVEMIFDQLAEELFILLK
jgi:hypothetical protein